MKVSTDACILGACTPVPKEGFVLDIGTGTGLLSLMIAQRCSCFIDAVELDGQSFKQALNNVAESTWSLRIKVHHEDIRSFHPSQKYDLIISNPPFFEKHLKSPSFKINKAKHADHLSLKELTTQVAKFLKPGGVLAVLLPEQASNNLVILAAEHNLFLQQQLVIRHNAASVIISVVNLFSGMANEHTKKKELICKDGAENYTPEFIELLKPFYLKL
ncbi:MAG: methyltransferase [Chitinophagales bacterium]